MLENEVVSLELSKKLKELGFPQKKSSLKWYGFYEIQCFSVERQEYTLQTANVEDDCVIELDAPLATEILRELPPTNTLHDNKEFSWNYYISNSYENKEHNIFIYHKDNTFHLEDYNLQNNLAKMWIWLKENDLLTQLATDSER